MSSSNSSAVQKSSEEADTVSEESVCVEFCAAIDSQILNSNLNSIKFLGLDTNQVMLQMCGNTFFSGQFQHLFGTNVLFEVKDKTEKNNKNEEEKQLNDNNKSLHYIGKCSQKLVMKRVFLESKQQNQSIHPSEEEEEEMTSS